MKNLQNQNTITTPHAMQQQGKGFIITGPDIFKVKVIIGDEEREVEKFKMVVKWLNPKDPNKPTYCYTLTMMVRTLEKNGIFPRTAIEAVRISAHRIYKKCEWLKIYDNRPEIPYPILAWWQEGYWLPVEHPMAKSLKK